VTGVRAIIDTNVLVSALLTGDRDAPPATVLDGMLAGRFLYLLSIELIAEYRRVLCRPRIARHHGLTEAEIEVLLTDVTLNGAVREPTRQHHRAADVGDRHLWDLLESDPTAVLVTGDQALRGQAAAPDRVITPRQFLALIDSDS
jgi:putative PIN family toxin of toxin-antitoxin system